ncbi:MAG: hypothetical protein ACO3C5_06500 [Ilumatobacteraceae bacterium]
MKRFIARIHTRLDDVRETHDHGGVAAEYGVLLAGIVAVPATTSCSAARATTSWTVARVST